MDDLDLAGVRVTRRGLIVGAVAAAGLATTGRAAAAATSVQLRTAIPGEWIEVDRDDVPVAPGITLTSFSTYGRAGWLRTHVLGADLGDRAVSVDLLAGKVSETRAISQAADAYRSVAAVNGNYRTCPRTASTCSRRCGDRGTARSSRAPGRTRSWS